jgi:hypothetical protein
VWDNGTWLSYLMRHTVVGTIKVIQNNISHN